MKRSSGILSVFTVLFALTLLLGSQAIAATPAASKKPPATTVAAAPKAKVISKADCLVCHGSYEKIIAATADYKMLSGDREITSNPHRYVPHDSKDIPECSYCHEPHPVPLSSKEGLPKPKTTWCYGCHHKKELTCGNCH
jgi:predicted CXXCH cytochrome family protein